MDTSLHLHQTASTGVTDKSAERIMTKADPSDVIIVIMGPTGSGKTNFINKLTGNTEQQKAASLKSNTQNVTPYLISYQDFRLVLVNTPSFDDTYRQDAEILREIANWLTRKYPDGTTLRIAGIIYLHRITDNRVSGSAYKNLQMFGRLCGNLPLRRVRLVTTMWDDVKDQGMAEERETELTTMFWQQLIRKGAIARRFYNTPASARDIVDDILRIGGDGSELLLQEELVEQPKHLNETGADKVLYARFQKLLAEQKKTLEQLEAEAKLQNDPALAKSLQEEHDKFNAQLQQTFTEVKEMQIPLSKRFILWLLGGKSRMQAVKRDHPQV